MLLFNYVSSENDFFDNKTNKAIWSKVKKVSKSHIFFYTQPILKSWWMLLIIH